MPALKPGTIIPTDAEDAEINRGIAADPDARELDAAWFTSARPAAEVLEPARYAALPAKRPPGRPKADKTKAQLTLRLDPEVIDRWRATGRGWQTRLGEWVARGPAAAAG